MSQLNQPTDPSPQPSRRQFLQTGALAAAGSFIIVPRHVLGKGFIAPSDKLNIAGVGIAGKGMSDTNNAFNNGANNMVALCDVDWSARTKANFDKHPNAVKYKDFRQMLDKEGKTIDAITVSTADHSHATVAMAAMQLGKHVYVQKPLTHNIHEARMLTEGARKHKVVTQMGNQGASNPDQLKMVEWYDKGQIGTVHTVHLWTNRPVWPQGFNAPKTEAAAPADIDWDTWIGPATPVGYSPLYHPFKWRGWWNFGAGALGDIGCHIMDMPFRVLGLGSPTDVECSTGTIFEKDWVANYVPEGCPPSSQVQMTFPATAKNKAPIKMTWADGGIRPFRPEQLPPDAPMGGDDGGVIMIGDKGIITCGLYGMSAKLYTKGSGTTFGLTAEQSTPQNKTTPEWNHQVLWTEACKAGFNSKEHKALTSSFDFSGPLTESVLMGNLAIRSYNLRSGKSEGRNFDYPGRKKLVWDGKNMKITNFDEANQFVSRQYRDGWKLA